MITLRSRHAGAKPPPAGALDHLRGHDEPYPSGDGEGLAIYSELILRPAANVRREANFDGEIILYVRRGTVRCINSTGKAHVTRAGGFMSASIRRGDSLVQSNESPTEDAQLIVIGVRSAQIGSKVCAEQRRVTAARRRDTLCIVASRDGEGDSLRISEDATVYSAILFRGRHVVHELASGRQAWLQVIEGKLLVGDKVAVAGDGVGVTGERAVSITARAETEILLIDLRDESS